MFARKKTLEEQIAEFIFRKSPDAYWVMDADKVIACNEAMARMIGTTVEKAIGLHPLEFSIETQPSGLPSHEAIKPMLAEIGTKGLARFEWWVQSLDGKSFPLYATLIGGEIAGQQVMVCFWQDIAAMITLREEQQRLNEEAAQLSRIQQATIQSILRGLQHMADGDLSFRIEQPLGEGFDDLRQSFNSSAERLSKTIGEIYGTTQAIDSGTQEIAASADDLSKRTERQAASLEETAAALEQITANVSSSTRKTEEARMVAQAAAVSAKESADVVTQAEGAMQRIEQASQKISNIIGVIDQIAFQTNLLALNAGVEAARAGEAGKGFAVVAQEVRELAQRSAQAAKEIASLIHNSSVEVDEGVRLVRDNGASLKTIIAHIDDINQHMEAIFSSAREQATGLSEVNVAVNHMDQTTQQNAAVAEESTAAAAALAQEAASLRALVSQFRTGEQDSRRTRSPMLRAA